MDNRSQPSASPDLTTRMLVSPFTFHRGAAVIMATDLAAAPRSPQPSTPSGWPPGPGL